MAQETSIWKVAAYGVAIVGSYFTIAGIPLWVYLGLNSPDSLEYLKWISIGLYSLLGLAIVFLLITQSLSNMDITKMKLQDWKDLFKFNKNRPQ